MIYTPSAFQPSWWLRGAHLQTVGARMIRSTSGVPTVRERIDTPDGDFLDLDFAFGETISSNDTRPLVLLLHGLEGSARSKYALETYRSLRAGGLIGVGLNFRSCSGELNRLPRLYHSGDTQDLALVLRKLVDRRGGRPLGVVGFSLGGNVLLKFLGELGDDASSLISVAATVSVPFNLGAGADYMTRYSGRYYAGFLIRKLQRKVLAKRDIMPPVVDVESALRARTFRTFDDAVTAPLHGFADAEDYYQRSSSYQFIPQIRVPTLLIQAKDDPFVPAAAIPEQSARDNPCIVTAFMDSGGHVGFVTGQNPRQPRFWAEREAAKFMRSKLRNL